MKNSFPFLSCYYERWSFSLKTLSSFYFSLLGVMVLSHGQEKILSFHQLTTDMGLTETTNEFLYTDSQNFTWISSLDGLNKFDGKEVLAFKPDARDSSAITGGDLQSPFFESGKGDIWFTTAEAINCLNRRSGTFIKVNPRGQKEYTTIQHYAFHLEKRRFLWVASDGDLFRIDTHKPLIDSRKPILEDFRCIRAAVEEDSMGNVKRIYAGFWNDSSGVEVIEFNSTGLYTSPKRELLFRSVEYPFNSKAGVSQIISNIGKETCLVTNQGLIFFKPGNSTDRAYERYPYPSSLFPESTSNYPHVTRNGNRLLLCGNTDKLAIFSLNRKERGFKKEGITAFNLDNKSFIRSITRVFMGRDSILWIGAKGEGIFYTNMKREGIPSLFHLHNLPTLPISYLFENSNDRILAISGNGPAWEFSKDGQRITEINHSYPKSFKQIKLSNGDSWAVSNSGLGKWNLNTKTFVWDPKASSQGLIFSFTAFKDKYLILGTLGHLQLYDLSTGDYQTFPEATFIVSLFIDNHNRLWTADGSDKIVVYELKENPLSLQKIKAFKNIGIPNHFAQDTLRKSILLASSIGLISFPEDLGSPTILTERDGLKNQYIRSVLVDKTHHIWMGTNKGIICYQPDSPKNPFLNLSMRDGLSAHEYSRGAALISEEGLLWFASSKGVDVISPKRELKGKNPTLAINSLKVHGKERKYDPVINQQDEIVFNSKENTLTLELAAPEYTDPIRNKFKTYLYHKRGVDSIIIETGNSITYTNLSYGKYTFRFTACNAEGTCQPIYKELKIRIKPPFYLSAWFLILTGILSVSILISVPTFIYRYRLRAKQLELEKQQRITERKEMALEKQQALQLERDQINAEFHSILNEGLITIKNTCSKAQKTQDMGEVSSSIDIIQEKTLDLFEKKKQLIWATDPENGLLEDLVVHIRFYTAKLLSDNNLTTDLQVPEAVKEVAISSKAKYNLFMTVKELLHNILKSSGASWVKLHIQQDEEELGISILDNGSGFEFEQIIQNRSKSYGLHKCMEWIRALNGAIQWEQRPEGGMITVIKIGLQELM